MDYITKNEINNLSQNFQDQIKALRQSGKSFNEIAKITDYTPQYIQQICKKLNVAKGGEE